MRNQLAAARALDTGGTVREHGRSGAAFLTLDGEKLAPGLWN